VRRDVRPLPGAVGPNGWGKSNFFQGAHWRAGARPAQARLLRLEADPTGLRGPADNAAAIQFVLSDSFGSLSLEDRVNLIHVRPAPWHWFVRALPPLDAAAPSAPVACARCSPALAPR